MLQFFGEGGLVRPMTNANTNKNAAREAGQTKTIKASKAQFLSALHAFIAQRSGLDARDYAGDRAAFMGDYRPILRDGKAARQLLRFVEQCDSITADDLRAGTRAYSGRLQFVEKPGAVGVDYTTGQYFPTEYRAAACAVLASVVWAWLRSCQGASATGETIRKAARREFGRGIAKTWFN